MASSRQAALLALVVAGCGPRSSPGVVLTFPASALGAEGTVLRRQLERFMEENAPIKVVLQPTPDAADQRHQLYVQWLNARAHDPDILQLDVVWTPEFAAAGWILPLDRFRPPVDSFLAAAIRANRWRGKLYALPWFVDAGMLYWRRDLLERPPATLDELAALAREASAKAQVAAGFVWQGARYEGLVAVFHEILAGFGGQVIDSTGRVVLDSPEGRLALRWLHAAVSSGGISPPAVLTWQEEQTRFAFQNGGAVFMRNWPYAFPLLEDSARSRVAGRVGVAPMPGESPGRFAATLGGQQLAINARTEHPDAAYRLIAFLTAPTQMLERVKDVGQYPTRPSLYDDPELARALPIDPALARGVVDHAVPRPVTPVYSELSEILQIWLHRALTGQVEPDAALTRATEAIRDLFQRVGLQGAR